MTPELRELYQQLIIDHGRNPRHFHVMDQPSCSMQGFNPLCGDELTLYLAIEDDVIRDVSFQGQGCAISMASASLMTEHLIGKSVAEAKQIFECFHHLAMGEGETDNAQLGKLTVLGGVREFPARVKCATLAWHTLIGALEGRADPVSTE